MTGPILVVEDDDVLVRTIVRNLAARGYTTRSASNVADAIQVIHEELPSLVLLDIDLPDGPGWDVARELRRLTDRSAPIIVVSALKPNQRLAGELRCAAVLEKPFPMESLLRLVAGALGRSTGERSHEAVAQREVAE